MSGKRSSKRKPAGRKGSEVQVRRVPGEAAWELLHPRCALERSMDMEDVAAMVEAGETEIAIDELRWLLSGCSDFIQAHLVLGELALELGDIPLARGHFGHAYRVGAAAIRKAKNVRPVPYSKPANQHFFQSGKGLAYCLKQLDKHKMASEIVEQLLSYDPTDPLNVGKL
ncbi:MAG: hypothetical protein N2C12_06290 [Planctomycetales bacterium]